MYPCGQHFSYSLFLVQIHLSIWYHFPSAYKTQAYFIVFYNIGLLVINSSSFCLSLLSLVLRILSAFVCLKTLCVLSFLTVFLSIVFQVAGFFLSVFQRYYSIVPSVALFLLKNLLSLCCSLYMHIAFFFFLTAFKISSLSLV